ncbi:MAG TPA: type 4a pilus biogenesis protein PilO [Pyrinomonadaceae bacterium]|nr:type 4a pilus biogenesis protein PilO [Pyrinomonadaceae bacterium]
MNLGNLKEQPWYLRLTIMGVVAVVVYAGFWYFITSGTRTEAKEINTQVETLMRQNEGARIASQRLNEFKVAYQNKQQEYDELKALLPEQRELTSVLQGVQDRARSSRLSLIRFSPRDDIQQDFYSGKPIQVVVNSSFQNLRSFFDQMARYQRIVSITDFKVNRIREDEMNASKTIDAQFMMTAYYVSAEKLQQSAPAAQPAPANNAQPAPAK